MQNVSLYIYISNPVYDKRKYCMVQDELQDPSYWVMNLLDIHKICKSVMLNFSNLTSCSSLRAV